MPWRTSPPIAPTPRAQISAKTLRRRPTEAEKRLWWHLRHRLPIEGSHFRRQVALDGYVVDFCCLDAKLIIEVDGGGHTYDAKAARDATRTKALELQGFRVLRFTNAEVVRSIDSVLETIFAALSPPPCGEGSGVGVVPPAAAADSTKHLETGRSRLKRKPAVPSHATPTSNSSPQGGGESVEP